MAAPSSIANGAGQGATPGPVSGSDSVTAILAEYGAITQDTMRKYLDGAASVDDHLYRIASDYPLRGGRALRASLCIASARAFGARIDDAVETAASLELLHNSFLVRDDVEDESEERRGRPALHMLHGVPTAINVADALTVLGLRPLLRNRDLLGPTVAWRVLQEAERMVRESVEGQAVELRWRAENAVDLDSQDYLRMTLKKTCWYTIIYPLRVGALIGTRGSADLDRYVRFGFLVGAAFQIQDDLLNLTGDPIRYGKEIAGDLLEGKRTLMLIHLLRQASGEDRARIGKVLAQPRKEKARADVDWIRDQMERHGSIEHARHFAHALAGAALHEFGVGFGDTPESRDKGFIRALPAWVLERK